MFGKVAACRNLVTNPSIVAVLSTTLSKTLINMEIAKIKNAIKIKK